MCLKGWQDKSHFLSGQKFLNDGDQKNFYLFICDALDFNTCAAYLISIKFLIDSFKASEAMFIKVNPCFS